MTHASSDRQRIQEECKSMASLLKKLEAEELALRAQNSILARGLINFGGFKSGMPESVSDSKGKQKRSSSTASAPTHSYSPGGTTSSTAGVRKEEDVVSEF